MSGAPLHGVALIRISLSPASVDEEFYAVFVRGQMSPIKFEAWSAANRHFRSVNGGGGS